jgi:hypothetical protein
MPSLHFGYSLLVGATLMQLPLSQESKRRRFSVPGLRTNFVLQIRPPSMPKLFCQVIGFLYPFTILIAIIATANHFILDAVAGALICFFALWCNDLMKNLLPLEDYIFWCLRLHKPVHHLDQQGAELDHKV